MNIDKLSKNAQNNQLFGLGIIEMNIDFVLKQLFTPSLELVAHCISYKTRGHNSMKHQLLLYSPLLSRVISCVPHFKLKTTS